MFRTLIFLLAVAISPLNIFLVGAAQAEDQQTVTLEVENTTCSMCPYTVKKALRKVNGVNEVVAKYEGSGEGWAKVDFDPTKTTVQALIVATEQSGYPSKLKS